MSADTPGTCSVYQSRLYSLAAMSFVLAFAAVCAWFFPHFFPRPGVHVVRAPDFIPPIIMPLVFALLISIVLVALLQALVVQKLAVRVDKDGIHYPRGWIPIIGWADVIAVERPPKVQRVGGEVQLHLRNAWRPLYITVRNPDRYLLRAQKFMRAALRPPGATPDRTVVQIPFMGMTPGSDVVEACIQRHLARMGRPPSPTVSPAGS